MKVCMPTSTEALRTMRQRPELFNTTWSSHVKVVGVSVPLLHSRVAIDGTVPVLEAQFKVHVLPSAANALLHGYSAAATGFLSVPCTILDSQ